MNLTLHALIARQVNPSERAEVISILAPYSLKSAQVQALFDAIGWKAITELGPAQREKRLLLLAWAAATLSQMNAGTTLDRLNSLAELLPFAFEDGHRLTVVNA